MECMYCGHKSDEAFDMYIVSATTEPMGTPHRWQDIGWCCANCHDVEGKPIEYENVLPPRSKHEI